MQQQPPPALVQIILPMAATQGAEQNVHQPSGVNSYQNLPPPPTHHPFHVPLLVNTAQEPFPSLEFFQNTPPPPIPQTLHPGGSKPYQRHTSVYGQSTVGNRPRVSSLKGPTRHKGKNNRVRGVVKVIATNPPRDINANKIQNNVQKSRDPVCNKCSLPGEPEVFHFHVSNEADREEAARAGKETYECFVCDLYHSVSTPARRKLLLTSSTLVNFWKADGFIPPVHFQVEAVVGGRIRDLTKVFQLRYADKEEPLDIVVAAGINNVMDKQEEAEIIKELADLQTAVYNHSRRWKHMSKNLPKNTISLLPIILPPKCVSFLPANLHPQGFLNKLSTIEAVNTALIGLNRVCGEPTVIFLNTYGIRNRNHVKRHRFSDWAEPVRSKKLHLTPKLKAIAATEIGVHFAKESNTC